MADITISNLSPLTVTSRLLIPASNGTSTGSVAISGITGQITSSNVTTALGYTPYNSTNPNNYIAAAGAPVQSVAARTGAVVLTKTDVGLSLVENKSSATIRGEITSSNVTTALGYTPVQPTSPAIAKAWVSFNGHGTIGQNQTIYRSYNVTNVVRNSNFNYTIYFTTPMPGTNYAFTGTSVAMGVVPTVREDATSQPINSCLTDRLLISTGAGGNGFIGSYVSIIVFA